MDIESRRESGSQTGSVAPWLLYKIDYLVKPLRPATCVLALEKRGTLRPDNGSEHDYQMRDPGIMRRPDDYQPPGLNVIRLLTFAYNLGNFLRRLALPRPVKHWSLTTPREKLIEIAANMGTYSRYVISQMAEVAVPRALFAATLDRIQRFGLLPVLMRRG